MGRTTSKAVGVTILGLLLGFASSAMAEPITLNFSGGIDLSTEGGPASNPFSGSITWDTNATPFEVGTGFAVYDPLSYTLFFNGVDVSAPVIGDGTGSGIIIGNDSDPLGTGTVGDVFGFFLTLELPFVLPSTGDNELGLVGLVTGSTSMFSSTGLPANFSFLNQVTGTQTLAFFDAGGDIDRFVDAVGPLQIGAADPVPEPATLALTTLGVALGASRARRARKRC